MQALTAMELDMVSGGIYDGTDPVYDPNQGCTPDPWIIFLPGC